jgi:hypothetical protein
MIANLSVAVRIRPISMKELDAAKTREQNTMAIVAKALADSTVLVFDPVESYTGARPRQKVFEFDHVFGENAEQEIVYKKSVEHQVDAVMQGYNATVFCYGATGVTLSQETQFRLAKPIQ